MKQIYDQHNIGKPYIPSNYKDVLARLEAEGKIQADPPADERPKWRGKVTFADKVSVTFPPRGRIAMATKSKIEWTQSTWNPVRGCTRVSEGCRFAMLNELLPDFLERAWHTKGW